MDTKRIRIFIYSPSDVQQERDVLHDLIRNDLQLTLGRLPTLYLGNLLRESHVSPGTGSIQESVFDQLGPNDIFVGIFWKRFGTPTDEHGSGSEAEFREAYTRWQKDRGRPLLMYFCERPFMPEADDLDQYQRVLALRQELGNIGLFRIYTEIDEFRELLRIDLYNAIVDLLPSDVEDEKSSDPKQAESFKNPIPVGPELYKKYSRSDVHSIFSPNTKFSAGAGTWGIHGIVKIPETTNSYVFFVSYGRQQGDHEFDEGITRDGELRWQSQPKESLKDAQIRALINHDVAKEDIHLFLRPSKRGDYWYLGKLKYLSHDLIKEKPVHFKWQILDWDPPSDLGIEFIDSSSVVDSGEVAEGRVQTKGENNSEEDKEALESIQSKTPDQAPKPATKKINWNAVGAVGTVVSAIVTLLVYFWPNGVANESVTFEVEEQIVRSDHILQITSENCNPQRVGALSVLFDEIKFDGLAAYVGACRWEFDMSVIANVPELNKEGGHYIQFGLEDGIWSEPQKLILNNTPPTVQTYVENNGNEHRVEGIAASTLQHPDEKISVELHFNYPDGPKSMVVPVERIEDLYTGLIYFRFSANIEGLPIYTPGDPEYTEAFFRIDVSDQAGNEYHDQQSYAKFIAPGESKFGSGRFAEVTLDSYVADQPELMELSFILVPDVEYISELSDGSAPMQLSVIATVEDFNLLSWSDLSDSLRGDEHLNIVMRNSNAIAVTSDNLYIDRNAFPGATYQVERRGATGFYRSNEGVISDTLTLVQKESMLESLLLSTPTAEVIEEIERIRAMNKDYEYLIELVTAEEVENTEPVSIKSRFRLGQPVYAHAVVSASQRQNGVYFKWYLNGKLIQDTVGFGVPPTERYSVSQRLNFSETGIGEIRIYNTVQQLIGRKTFYIDP